MSVIEKKKDEISSAESKYPLVIDQLSKFIIPKQDASLSPKFNILQSREEIQLFASRLVKSAESRIMLNLSVQDLEAMYYNGMFDILSEARALRGITIEILTEVELASLDLVQQYSRFATIKHRLNPSKMKLIIKDDREVIITVANSTDTGQQEDIALWTNSKSFASAMQAITKNDFSEVLDLSARISSLRTGKPVESIKMITDEQEYLEARLGILASACQEVFIGFKPFPLFSSKQVLETLKRLAEIGVKVRILCELNSNEIDVVKDLHHLIEFRKCAFTTNVQLLIVDEREILFSGISGKLSPDVKVFSNSSTMVSFMHKIASDIWSVSGESDAGVSSLEKFHLVQQCLDDVKNKMEKLGWNVMSRFQVIEKLGQSYQFDLVVTNESFKNKFAVTVFPYIEPHISSTHIMSSKIKIIDCDSFEHIVGIIPGDEDGKISELSSAMGIQFLQSDSAIDLAGMICETIITRK